MNAAASTEALRFVELDELEAPSWESFYQGALVGIGLVGAVVVAT